jgi:streptogramin lyase
VTNRFPATTNTVAELSPVGAFLTSYANGGIVGPLGVAIDTAGSVWVTSEDSDAITEIGLGGRFFSGTNGFTGGGMMVPEQIAIDRVGNAWVADGSNRVIEVDFMGNFLSGSNGFTGGGLNQPFGIAIDAAGNAWVTNSNDGSVTEFEFRRWPRFARFGMPRYHQLRLQGRWTQSSLRHRD